MKTLLKLGMALIVFGLLLSTLGVGIIRTHAVKPLSATSPTPVSASMSATASASVSTTAVVATTSAVASVPAK